MKRFFILLPLLALQLQATPADALDYGSANAPAAILYDAPSREAKKLYVVSRGTPFERVVTLKDWVKVRSQTGIMAWMERSDLGDAHNLVVTAAQADVHQRPDPASPVLFHVNKSVILELIKDTGIGWFQVRHADGSIGYIKTSEVWGG